MQIKPECIPCILRMGLSSMRKLDLDEDTVRALFCRIAEIPALRCGAWDVTSPEIIERVMKIIISATEDADPFYHLKAKQNRSILGIEPSLRRLVEDASDPLLTAAKLAILGNAIDLMMVDSPADMENYISERLKAPVPKEAYGNLRDRLKDCRSLVYLGDNAGEIVIDRLLVEIIQDLYGPEMVYVVRSEAVLNDATLNEAGAAGLDKVIRVVENGIDGPFPGTVQKRCSEEVNHLLNRADLIISKGGGNFDSLSEEESLRGKTAFLLLSKCRPYCRFFGVGLHDLILACPS
jgi:uncharacterized protein with ATP-grasp and redox domains